MEHQTCTSLGGWSEALIAHELAHQWWGDMITCRDFHHIWLNEGFATYSEALYWEQVDGKVRYFEDMRHNEYFGSGTIYVPDLSDVWRIFHGGLSYRKGSCVLHMLRHVVGDSTFFDILHAYYDSQFQHGTAVTEDFQAICEAVSGMELDWFFQEWIYGEYYPIYAYHWSSTKQGGDYDVTLKIEQLQTDTTGLFTMPIDVTFLTYDDEKTFVVFDSLQIQTFELTLNFYPLFVILDEEGWILKKTVTPGDVTGEGRVDISDILIVAYFIVGRTNLTEEQFRAADCTGDGLINVIDLVSMANIILLGRP